jgi:hypothetical protein
VGTPTEAGSFPVEAEVADSSDPSLSVTAGFTLTVKPATGEGGQGGKGSEGRKGGESNEGKAGNGSQGGGGVSGSTAGAGGGTAGAASASSGGKEVSVPLSCEDPAGASCELSVQFSVTETIENGRVTAVSSRVRASGARFSSRKRNGRGKRAVHKTIVIGRVSATLTAGQHKTVTVKLNATGRKLLEQHHSLKIALTVTQAAGAGKPRTVDSSRLTLRGGKHRHRTERTARRSG